MGLYPEEKYQKQRDGLVVFTRELPGIKKTIVYIPILEVEERDDCYCCTCPTLPGQDIYCRNHGWAGERYCDIHGIGHRPSFGLDGERIATVNEERARLRSLEVDHLHHD